MKKFLSFIVLALFCLLSTQALPFVTTPGATTYPIHWYYLKINGVYLLGTSGGTVSGITEIDAESDYYDWALWCFVATNSGKIYIYNKAQKQYMYKGYFLNPYYSSSNNYVEEGSGNSFYICYNDAGEKWYIDYGDGSGFDITSWPEHPVIAIEALVEDYIDSGAEIVFSDLEVYADHCTFGYDVINNVYGCEYFLYVNGQLVGGNSYSVQRTSQAQTLEAEAHVTFSANPRIRELVATKTYVIPALANVPGDVNGDGNVTSADVTAIYNLLLNNDDSAIVNGDQNGDGDITAADVTSVYNFLLGSK